MQPNPEIVQALSDATGGFITDLNFIIPVAIGLMAISFIALRVLMLFKAASFINKTIYRR